jgi:mono/diheme cytochrome c family protein
MKGIIIFSTIITAGLIITACEGKGNKEGRVYMPDMAYSRAYETYGDKSNLQQKGIHFTGQPVPGTIARGDSAAYEMLLGADTVGMYTTSRAIENPYKNLDSKNMKEAERLYMVNCAICHGSKLDGNGPLYNDGNGPFTARPQTLNGEYAAALADGQIYFVITHGIRSMGSYASQLNPKQRWMIVSYLRSKKAGGATTADSASAAKPDSALTR